MGSACRTLFTSAEETNMAKRSSLFALGASLAVAAACGGSSQPTVGGGSGDTSASTGSLYVASGSSSSSGASSGPTSGASSGSGAGTSGTLTSPGGSGTSSPGSSGNGLVCPPCASHADCQARCAAAPAGSLDCCDLVAGTCYALQGTTCPATQPVSSGSQGGGGCTGLGNQCNRNSDCCSQNCGGNVCTRGGTQGGMCAVVGAPCMRDRDCCTQNCNGNGMCGR
jgi:hypothetical protein